MGFPLEPHEPVKRGEKPSYCRFCATKNTRSRLLQLFFKQSLEGFFSEIGHPQVMLDSASGRRSLSSPF